MSTMSHIPPGYKKVRATKSLEYAQQQFAIGAVLVIDDDAAARFIREKAAVAIELPTPEHAEIKACAQCGQPVYPCGHPASP